jgi:hypothetical protein
MARPVDYRKGRGSKGVHTEDEQLPIGKKDQARGATSSEGQKVFIPHTGNEEPTDKGKHSAGHAGQSRSTVPVETWVAEPRVICPSRSSP